MTSPTVGHVTSDVPLTFDSSIDSLIAATSRGGLKWDGPVGTGASLAFSFPWTTNSSAAFYGYNGQPYSDLNENLATYHYGFTAAQMAAARGALQAWADVANVKFNEVAETSTDVGDIRFAWTSAGDTTTTGSRAWGWAWFPNAFSPSGGDVWVSTQSSAASDTDWSAGSYNFGALVHEIGHTLGLKHPFDGTPLLPSTLDTKQFSVMSYSEGARSLFVDVTQNANGTVSWHSFNVQPETPMVLDIAAIQYLYGANTTYRTGDDVYTFDPARPFLKTIWDAGGNDTISVANFTRGCTVDLQPGHYSSIAIPSDSTAGYNWSSPPPTATYDGTSNLGIAYGAVIENAIGGAGNDVLRGNDVANHLEGGAGNDTEYGGAGNDVFDDDAAQRAGSDTFYGGSGDDTYWLTPGDQVVENAGEGNDTVCVSFSYTLADNVENAVVFGAAGCTLTGNALDNSFTGGAGNDTISGGSGSDTVVYDGLSSAYTISASGAGFTISSSAGGVDLLSAIEFAQFSDRRVTLQGDLTAPTLVAATPASGAGDVAVGMPLALTFSEAIQRGAGSIVLKTAAGATVATFDAASSPLLAVSGSTLTISPPADLAAGTAYVLQFGAGTIQDRAGNVYAPGAGFTFTTTSTGQVVRGSGSLAGTAGADTLHGGAANDTLTGNAGNDFVDGGAGLDTAIFSGNRASYTIVRSGSGATVSGPDGIDTLAGVERLQFSGDASMVALDIDGTGGQAYRLYQAAFARTPDSGGLGYWINVMDHGAGLRDVAAGFMGVPEFAAAYGANPSNGQLVNQFYQNILHRAPDTGGYQFWLGVLDQGRDTQAGVLASISESAENQAGVIGVIGNGFAYTPYQ